VQSLDSHSVRVGDLTRLQLARLFRQSDGLITQSLMCALAWVLLNSRACQGTRLATVCSLDVTCCSAYCSSLRGDSGIEVCYVSHVVERSSSSRRSQGRRGAGSIRRHLSRDPGHEGDLIQSCILTCVLTFMNACVRTTMPLQHNVSIVYMV
jgi:hypothetical protein